MNRRYRSTNLIEPACKSMFLSSFSYNRIYKKSIFIQDIRLTSPQCRAGHRVVRDGSVRVEVDTRVGVLIERCASGARGVGCARAGDLNIKALRVVLRAVERASTVQGDDLVAEDVIARGQRLGHRGGPLAALVDQRLGRPLLSAVVDYKPTKLAKGSHAI